MSLLLCPVCHKAMTRGETSYSCKSGHNYDRAGAGYVHLLLPKDMNSKLPGDSKEMVAARTAFLNEGHYACLREALSNLAVELLGQNTQKSPTIIDTGCGEGYYTLGLYSAQSQTGRIPRVVGVDISKFALRHAAKRSSEIEYAVASMFRLPLADEVADLMTDVFAPIADVEFARVVKPGGYLVVAAPGPDHLWGLKQLLYEAPYPNDDLPPVVPGFELVDKQQVADQIVVEGTAVQNLFHMTPYFWKTPREGAARLAGLDRLETPISFSLFVFRRSRS